VNDAELHAHLHAELCRVADLVLFRFNPCGRDEDGCIAGEECCEEGPGYVHRPGERGCIFLGPHGCTTANLGCKLYLCDKAREHADPRMLATFRLLDELARLWELTSVRPTDG
jgi:hypothetical protein